MPCLPSPPFSPVPLPIPAFSWIDFVMTPLAVTFLGLPFELTRQSQSAMIITTLPLTVVARPLSFALCLIVPAPHLKLLATI